MDSKLVLLGLYLNELGVDQAIDTKEKRLILQKAVYLAQAAGADLGYRYSWYVNGPYSTDLTRDYYRLSEERPPDFANTEYELRNDIRNPLQHIKPLLTRPDNWNKSAADWFELLASLDYAMRVNGMAAGDASQYVARHKPHLADSVDLGISALNQSVLSGVN